MSGRDLRAGRCGVIETGAIEHPQWVRVGDRSEKSTEGRQ